MKKTISALLLSLPLTVLAADIKLEDLKGQYVSSTSSKRCLDKIVVDVMKNRLMIYDITNGKNVLNREIYNETVKFSDTLVEGKLEDSVLTEKRYELKKIAGIVRNKKLLSELIVTIGKDKLKFEEDAVACSYIKDLPEITVKAEEAGQSPDPVVEVGDITERANTEYVSLKRYYRSADELLDISQAETILKRLLTIKSATDKYHSDLIEMIIAKEELAAGEISLALKMPYFTSKDLQAINAKIKEVNASEKPDYKLLDILTQNRNVAQNFGSMVQFNLIRMVSQKTKELSLDEVKSILKVLFPSDIDQSAQELIKKIKDLSLDDKRILLPALEEAQAFTVASGIAVEIIKNDHPGFSTDELLSNLLKLKKETHALVVGALGKDVSDPGVENFLKLALTVKDASALSSIANAFLINLPLTAASDILQVAGKLSNGHYTNDAYKDLFLIRSADQVKPLSQADALAMLKLASFDSNRAILFKKLISRITEELSVEEFEVLSKSLNNGHYSNDQYRDSAVLEFYAKVSDTDSNSNLKLIDILSNQSSRKTLAMNIWKRDQQKSMSKLLALSNKVENGHYSNDQYRDQVLVEGIKSLPKLSVDEMRLYLDKLSSSNRVSQIQANLSKLPELSVDDLAVLVNKLTNGYYTNDQYKDQGILLLLPKTIITKQAEVSFLTTLTSNEGTKRQIHARGLKLTLPVADLTELVRRESSSVLKVEIIKGLAPKVAPLSAVEIVALIKSVDNGHYTNDQYKTESLNFLLNLVKVSSIDEIKLLMQQRSDSASRVAIFNKLKGQLGAVIAANLISVADLIENGYYTNDQYKDDLLVSESKQITSVSKAELLKLVDKVSSAANDRTIIIGLAPKIENLSDLDLSQLVVKIENGYYTNDQHRDDTAVILAPKVQSVSTEGINSLIKTLSSHLARKKVALTLLAKKASVSKDDILAVSANISNGSYTNDQHQTQFLSEAVALIK